MCRCTAFVVVMVVLAGCADSPSHEKDLGSVTAAPGAGSPAREKPLTVSGNPARAGAGPAAQPGESASEGTRAGRLPPQKQPSVPIRVAALIEKLAEEDVSTRVWAANQLGTCGADAVHALPHLVKLLSDHRDVGLVHTGPWGYHRGSTSVSSQAAGTLVHIGGPAVEPLIAVVRRPVPDVASSRTQEEAVIALGEIGDRRAVEVLIGLLDEDVFTRRYAAGALAKIGDGRAIGPLLRVLQKDEHDLAVLRALGELKAPDAVPALIAIVRDPPFGNCLEEAARALGKIGDSRAVEPLIDAIPRAAEWSDRAAVIEALGLIGDARATDAILPVIRDDEYTLVALTALASIGDSRATGPLVGLLGHGCWAIWKAAGEALQKIGASSDSIPEAKKVDYFIATGKWEEVRKMGKTAADSLMAVLEVQEAKTAAESRSVGPESEEADKARAKAAQLLGELGCARSAPHLVTVLRQRPCSVEARAAAARALGRIGSVEAVPDLAQATCCGSTAVMDAAADALVQIGEPSVDALAEKLKNPHSPGQGHVLAALRRIGGPKALAALRKASLSDNAFLRAAAERALQASQKSHE